MSFSNLMKNNFGQGGAWVADQGTNGLRNMLSKVLAAFDALCADGPLTAPGLAEGTTASTDVAHDAVHALIGGSMYEVAAGEVAPDALTEIPDSKAAAWALDLGIDGTVDIAECDTNSDAFYDTVAEAVAALPAVAANHTRLGYVTLINDGAVFTPGTTGLDAATVTVTYNDVDTIVENLQAIQPS